MVRHRAYLCLKCTSDPPAAPLSTFERPLFSLWRLSSCLVRLATYFASSSVVEFVTRSSSSRLECCAQTAMFGRLFFGNLERQENRPLTFHPSTIEMSLLLKILQGIKTRNDSGFRHQTAKARKRSYKTKKVLIYKNHG